VWLAAAASAATVDLAVLGLFRSAVFEVQPAPGSVLEVETPWGVELLEGSAAKTVRAPHWLSARGRNGAPVEFTLRVPGRIERRYRGTLRIRPEGKVLVARVEMDLETAVASIITAEAGSMPLEALRAHAVAARSFLLASRKRHAGFAFCDTTHCQFLRESPAPKSMAWYAARSTAGLAISYQGRPVPAMYSAVCGGRTRTMLEAGWRPSGYPFFAVECKACRGHAARGHRVGLCQTGAGRLAMAGQDFRAILDHYFPGTVLLETDAFPAP
jgi:peptidoglycan hydrolase-like amidase